jgi:hypothetical protein
MPPRTHAGAKSRVKESQSIQQFGPSGGDHGGELSAPTHAEQNHGNPRVRLAPKPANFGKHLGHVVDEPVRMSRVPAILRVLSRPSAIEKPQIITRFREPAARILVPSRMALNSMKRNNVTPRRSQRNPVPIAKLPAVRGDVAAGFGSAGKFAVGGIHQSVMVSSTREKAPYAPSPNRTNRTKGGF